VDFLDEVDRVLAGEVDDVPWADAARWSPPPVWRLPVMTSNLRGDWRAAMAAHRAAVEPWQERACLLRIGQLAERQAATRTL